MTPPRSKKPIDADVGRRCAIYARKSTDEQLASTDVQVREATRWIEDRKWMLVPDGIYIDDAKSRAEFKRRPALLQLIADAQSGLFDTLVIRDETRLGGDMLRTGLVIQDIIEAPARIFHYASNEEVHFDDPTQKLMVSIRNYASELERAKISGRVRENLLIKARDGFNAGGAVFGYDNKQVFTPGPDGKDRKLRTEYVINLQEARVVQRIFLMYADALGYRAIARILNAEGIASPKAGRRGSGSWCSSSVRTIIINERYRGRIPYNKTEKTYRGGTRVRITRDESEWMLVPAPHLQIVDDVVWDAADVRRPRKALDSTGKRVGRPPTFLLSGLMRCGECGGPMQVVRTKDGHENVRAYACSYHRNRGASACSNSRRRPMRGVDTTIMNFLIDEILEGDLYDDLCAAFRRKAEARFRALQPVDPAALRVERQKLTAEIVRLSGLLAGDGAGLDGLVVAVREREARVREIDAKLAALTTNSKVEPISLQARRAEKDLREQLTKMRSTLLDPAPLARCLLEAMFPDGLRAYPTIFGGRKRLRIEGTAVFGPVILGEHGGFTGVTNAASPAGFEPAYLP